MRLPLLASLLFCGIAVAEDPKPDDSRLGAKPPSGATVLFDGNDTGKANLDAWCKNDGKSPADWPVTDNMFTVGKGKGDIRTKDKFGDFQLHLEFATPLMPEATGQGRGNSGVYLTGSHELQILDSYGLKPQKNDCGAIYLQYAPSVNACKPPLQWQSYDVTFLKAKVVDGKVEKKARVTVIQNGVTILDNKEISPTPGGVGTPEGSAGPLMLQDHGNAVQFRNIWIAPL